VALLAYICGRLVGDLAGHAQGVNFACRWMRNSVMNWPTHWQISRELVLYEISRLAPSEAQDHRSMK
jgi:hypothetical protein